MMDDSLITHIYMTGHWYIYELLDWIIIGLYNALVTIQYQTIIQNLFSNQGINFLALNFFK